MVRQQLTVIAALALPFAIGTHANGDVARDIQFLSLDVFMLLFLSIIVRYLISRCA